MKSPQYSFLWRIACNEIYWNFFVCPFPIMLDEKRSNIIRFKIVETGCWVNWAKKLQHNLQAWLPTVLETYPAQAATIATTCHVTLLNISRSLTIKKCLLECHQEPAWVECFIWATLVLICKRIYKEFLVLFTMASPNRGVDEKINCPRHHCQEIE